MDPKIQSDSEILNSGEVEISESNSFVCPSCGGTLKFDAESQKLKCDHCGSTVDVAMSSDVTERDFEELSKDHEWQTDIKVIRCEHCGAEVVLRKNEIATKCVFCGAPNVVDESEFHGVKPDSMIPFRFTQTEAIAKCMNWLKKRVFAPRKFKKSVDIESVKGTYYPIWTFDSTTETHYSGTLGKYYYVTVRRNNRTYRERRVRWFQVNGTDRQIFDDLLVSGSKRITNSELQKLGAFDQRAYVKYDDKILAGNFAVNYDVDPFSAFKEAEARMRAVIRNKIVQSYGADVVGNLQLNVRHLGKSFKYLMLPIYICTERYKKKVFRQYINGLIGKIYGKTPLSWLKILLTVLGGGAIIALIVWLISIL